MSDEETITNPSANGRTDAQRLSPKRSSPKKLSTHDEQDKTVKRCADLFKNLKLEPLKFDNKRGELPQGESNMSPNRQKRHKPKKQKENEMQLVQQRSTSYYSHYNQMPTLVIQAMLHTLCKLMKKDDDEREHLFQFLYDQLERLHAINPVGKDHSLAEIRNKYNNVFDQLIMSYPGGSDDDGKVAVSDLIVSKYKFHSAEFTKSLSVLMNAMPEKWSTMSFLEPSRYQSEFLQMKLLGQGGFGKVYSAKNKVDEMIYAVKKVPLYCTNEKKLTTVKREVQLMAKLKHPNIVSYYSSWWEAGDCCGDSSDSQESSTYSYSQSTSSNGNHRSGNSRKNKVPVTLYIQMELCQITLDQHLKERNELLALLKGQDPFEIVEAEFCFDIFQQIVIGVEYIHSQSMLHRDLKPSNVFVDKEKRLVQIGDFGLARNEWISPIDELSQGPYTPLATQNGNFTAKLGTESYAAPEQLDGSYYDNKADMYSLGLIDFELFYPFETKMERAKTIMSLRRHEGNIPELNKIKEKWPIQAKIIAKLLCHNKFCRPSATELIEMFPRKSQEDHIKELEEQLRKKEEVITKMAARISNQEIHIKNLEVQKKRLWRRIGSLTNVRKKRHSGGDSSVSE